jgi:hypothetical protein
MLCKHREVPLPAPNPGHPGVSSADVNKTLAFPIEHLPGMRHVVLMTRREPEPPPIHTH